MCKSQKSCRYIFRNRTSIKSANRRIFPVRDFLWQMFAENDLAVFRNLAASNIKTVHFTANYFDHMNGYESTEIPRRFILMCARGLQLAFILLYNSWYHNTVTGFILRYCTDIIKIGTCNIHVRTLCTVHNTIIGLIICINKHLLKTLLCQMHTTYSTIVKRSTYTNTGNILQTSGRKLHAEPGSRLQNVTCLRQGVVSITAQTCKPNTVMNLLNLSTVAILVLEQTCPELPLTLVQGLLVPPENKRQAQ